MSFTIGSLFDGSGGFPLAASLCGGTPKWASEVEPYPIAVTKSRFPGVKHLGSVIDIKGGEVEPVDVITFGSPCQDLSVAGKRAGLKHEANGDDETTRSGLFMEAVRIIKEMREATNGVYPRFALWENVPGAFSSNRGEDFRIVLQELIQIVEPTAVMPEVPKNGWPYADSYCGDGWSLAYRVFDSQFWGVPQRRRRIYLVLDLRGECAGKVSFEREGLRGYFETGRTPWQTAAGDAESGSGTANCERNCITLEPGIASREGGHIYEGVSGTLRANAGDNQMAVAYPICMATQQGGAEIMKGKCPTITASDADHVPCAIYSVENHPADSRVNLDKSGKVQTLTSRMGTGGGNVPMIMEQHAATYWDGTQVIGTLTANNAGGNQRMPDKENFNCVIEAQPITVHGEVISGTLLARDYKGAGRWDSLDKVVAIDRAFFNQGQNALYDPQLYEDGTNPTLVARGPNAVAVRYIVRRLTPTECARLQGFPDTWGHPNWIDENTKGEIAEFWRTVYLTDCAIKEKKPKPRIADKQDGWEVAVIRWYNGLHNDSSEYKMWGNGIALPNALYMMQGIADVMSEEKAARRKWLEDLLGGCL